MKKYLAICILALLSSGIFAQATFQASIQPVPAASSVTVMVRTSAEKMGKVSGLTLTVAIPVSAGARPPLGVAFPNPNISLSVPIYAAVNQNIDGVPHYIYNILAEGSVLAAVPATTFAANTDIAMATIGFGGNPALSSQIKLVNLPDGGTADPNPNSYFGFSIDGADVVNLAAMFYSIPGISTAINDGNGNAGTSFAQTTGIVPLPVKFLGFNATRKDNNAVLTWQIENESSLTHHYEVERSLNAVDFIKVNTVSPKNNGNSTNSYDLTDVNISALRSSGIFYYRVKQVDKDGHFTYTGIKSVRFTSNGLVLGVYPNPVKNYATLTIDVEKDTDAAVSITDGAGKQVQNTQMNLFKGPNIKRINMGAFAAGNYMLKIQTPTEIKTLPVVKTN